mgnify:CR=1 FL=1
MTEDEICVRYRQAKHRVQQRHILAELNLCRVEDIDRILERNGFSVKKVSKYAQRVKIDKEKALEMWRNGKTVDEIADKFGVKKRSVYSMIERNRA